MQEVIICRGVPGSGKSFFATTWVKAGRDRVRINRDDIRKMCFDKFFGVDEEFVTVVEESIYLAALTQGKSVVVDNTNITPKYVNKFKNVAEDLGVPVSVKEFDVPLAVALARNMERDRQVPHDVIVKMHTKMKEVGSLA